MATTDVAALRLASKQAYEWGRVRFALRMLWVVLPLAAVALVIGAPGEALVCLTVLLVLGGSALRWKGGTAGTAVMPGLLAGALPLAAAPVTAACCTGPAQAAVGVGLVAAIAGAALATFFARKGGTVLLVSLGVALSTACLSCVAGGPSFIVSAAAGLAAGASVWTLLRRKGTLRR